MSNSLWPHGLEHARLPCPPPTPGPCSNSCPLSWWCHPVISFSDRGYSSMCPEGSSICCALIAVAQVVSVLLSLIFFVSKIRSLKTLIHWKQVRYLADFLTGYEGDSLTCFHHCFSLPSFSSSPSLPPLTKYCAGHLHSISESCVWICLPKIGTQTYMPWIVLCLVNWLYPTGTWAKPKPTVPGFRT